MKNTTNNIKISVVIPFYNTPIKLFKACIESVQKLNPFEIILVDDCSSCSDAEGIERIEIAKRFTYFKTHYQSGMDGLPFNLGVSKAKGDYICRVDSDDILLSLPDRMTCDVHFGNLNRVKSPENISVENLILHPRAVCNAMVAKKEIWEKYPYEEGGSYYTDVLCVLRILHNKHSFSVNKEVNYIYNKRQGSIQTSKKHFYHRLSHMQTVSRFCQLENINQQKSIGYLELAMLNVRYGGGVLKSMANKL